MIFDLIGVLFFIAAIIKGYRQGLIRSLFTFTGSFIAVIAAVLFSGQIITLVSETMEYEGRWLPALAFLIVFFVIIIFVKIITKIAESFAEMVMLGWVNQLAGIALFLLLSILCLSTFIYLINIIDSDLQSMARGSYLYVIIKPIAPSVFTFISEHWTAFREALTALNHIAR